MLLDRDFLNSAPGLYTENSSSKKSVLQSADNYGTYLANRTAQVMKYKIYQRVYLRPPPDNNGTAVERRKYTETECNSNDMNDASRYHNSSLCTFLLLISNNVHQSLPKPTPYKAWENTVNLHTFHLMRSTRTKKCKTRYRISLNTARVSN